MFGLALLFVCFFCPFSILITLLGERELAFVLIVHLFVSYAHVNLCHFFSSSWCQGLTATPACGSSWTFLFAWQTMYFRERTGIEGILWGQQKTGKRGKVSLNIVCDAPACSKVKESFKGIWNEKVFYLKCLCDMLLVSLKCYFGLSCSNKFVPHWTLFAGIRYPLKADHSLSHFFA